jgi:integrase
VPGKSVTWVVRYRDYAGHEHSETFHRKKAAYDRDADVRRELARGTWVDPAEAGMTLRAYVTRWSARPGRESTRRNRAHLIGNLGEMGELPLRELRADDVDRWVSVLTTGRPWAEGRPLAPATVRQLAGSLRGVLAAAVAAGLLDRSPAAGVRLKVAEAQVDTREVPTAEQYAALAEVSPRWFVDAMEWAATTGMRAGEVAGLTGRDLVDGDVSVRHQCPRRVPELTELKTRSARRTIPVPGNLADRFSTTGAADRVIAGVEGRGTSTPMICAQMRMSRKAVTAAGGPDVSRVTFHGFRHLYASSQLADGVPLPMVSALLGHGSIAVTSRVYAHWLPGQRELAASSAEALAGRLGV